MPRAALKQMANTCSTKFFSNSRDRDTVQRGRLKTEKPHKLAAAFKAYPGYIDISYIGLTKHFCTDYALIVDAAI